MQYVVSTVDGRKIDLGHPIRQCDIRAIASDLCYVAKTLVFFSERYPGELEKNITVVIGYARSIISEMEEDEDEE